MTSHVQLPVLLSDLHRSSASTSRPSGSGHPGGRSPDHARVSPAASLSGGDDDIENVTSASVVGREAGERDPLLLRDRMISEEQIDSLKRYVCQSRFMRDFQLISQPTQGQKDRQEGCQLLLGSE